MSRNTNFSFLHLNGFLHSCSSLAHLHQLHARAITQGLLQSSLPLATKFITLASGLSLSLEYARHMFDIVPRRDTPLWNTIIRAYANVGPCEEALLLYRDMHLSGLSPDCFTFPFVLRSCAVLSALRYGRQVHCNVIKNELSSDVYVQSSLVAMYSQSGEVADAELIFQEMGLKNIVSWTSMVAGYAQNGMYKKVVELFRWMICSGVQPNEVSLASILPACVGLECLRSGELIHGYAVKSGFNLYNTVGNALIAMYGKCGYVEMARRLFDGMIKRTSVSWNAIIAAYEQNNEAKKAIRLFQRMLTEKVEVDYITLVSVLSACASSGDLDVGKWIHKIIRNRGLESNLSIGNALLDMYAKSGSIKLARVVFDDLPKRSVVSWSAMISAYATHGHGEDALELFSQMREEGLQPNRFTFVSVLAACCRSGLVEEGRRIFDQMGRDFSVTPSVEHYVCMVDLLARAGKLKDAYEFIENMPIRPDADVWCALLGGCRIHGNLELAEIVAEHLSQLCKQNTTKYVLMSNIYAESGRWEDAERLREHMKQMELKKHPGNSVVKMKKISCISF